MTNDPFRLSFEFYPPKTDVGREKLNHTQNLLQAEFEPRFFSITYGAGGSTRDNTLNTVRSIREKGVDVAPHLSFGGDNKEEIIKLISQYQSLGVKRIVALRGDIPSGMGGAHQIVYANELVTLIKQNFGEHFHLEVAAYPETHPEANTFSNDIHYLKQKFEAGADSAITQYFYNIDAYFYFMDACAKAGIDKPIYPGIMPIINVANLIRFSKNCGADIPRWLKKKLEDFSDDNESLKQFGIDLVTNLSQKLLEGGAPGLHFYTMNQHSPTADIVRHLKGR